MSTIDNSEHENQGNKKIYDLIVTMAKGGADWNTIRIAAFSLRDQIDVFALDEEIDALLEKARLERNTNPAKSVRLAEHSAEINGAKEGIPDESLSKALKKLLDRIEEDFGPRTRLAAEVCLSAIAATRLTVSENPVWIILTGPPSTGKTTILSFFLPTGAEEESILGKLTYKSDKFTPKSFVSHAANVSKDKLEEVDLLPKIKHKILITTDLTTMLGQDFETVRETMSTLTALGDGKGLSIDSGTHGKRGYTGDYGFGWLGATTKVSSTSWAAMGSVGPRLLFLSMSSLQADEPTPEELAAGVTSEQNCPDKVKSVQALVENYMQVFIAKHPTYKGSKWDKAKDKALATKLGLLAKLTAKCRSSFEEVENEISLRSEEIPLRLMSQLYGLACGRAALDGRNCLEYSDLKVVYQVAISSMPEDTHKVVLALLGSPNVGMTIEQLANTSGVSSYRLKKVITKLKLVNVIEEIGNEITLNKTFLPLKNEKFIDPDSEDDASSAVAV